ncbi:MAG: hypothetical protein ACRC33_16125 [Gemmataceae bacterium]
MTAPIDLRITTRSFAGPTTKSAIVASTPAGSVAGSLNGGAWTFTLPAGATEASLAVTGSDAFGPLFPRTVKLTLGPPQVVASAGPDPELPVGLMQTGTGVALDVVLPRLRELVVTGVTGTEAVSGTFVSPASVDPLPPGGPGGWDLTPASASGGNVRKLVLETPAGTVPGWLAVAFPEGQATFSDLLVFYAPQPPQDQAAAWAGAYPSGYSNHVQQYLTAHPSVNRAGNKRLAFQLAQSGKKAVFVYPVIEFFSADMGLMTKAAGPLLNEVVHYLIQRFATPAAPPMSLAGYQNLAAASFSYGASRLTAFLNGAGAVKSSIREVYDFDSEFIKDKSVPNGLASAAAGLKGALFRRYNQSAAVPFGSRGWTEAVARHRVPLPAARWASMALPGLALHQDIANHMLTHALARSPMFR